MNYVILFVLVSIHLVFGEELIGSNGAVYKFERKKNRLGAGSFGEAIRGTKNVGPHCEPVAMKFEKIQSKMDPYVFNEKTFYKLLAGHPAIPIFHDCLRDKQGNGVLVVELLGRNLAHYRKMLGGTFSIKTTMMIGCQLLTIIEYLHSKGVIYNDIKPENFAVGYHNTTNIYILDFGLSTFYLKKNKKHVEPEKIPAISGRGTGKYMSIYAHTHVILSRRDDIESIAYMLIEFLRGKLPWYYGKTTDQFFYWKRKMEIIKIVGDKCTNTLFKFLSYARRMKFKDTPDYNYLRGLLLNELNIHGFQDDNQFDWTNIANPNISGVAKAKPLKVLTKSPLSIRSIKTATSDSTKAILMSVVKDVVTPIITQLITNPNFKSNALATPSMIR